MLYILHTSSANIALIMSLAPNPSKAPWSWQMTPHRPWYGCSPLLLTYSPTLSLLSPLLPCSLISFCQTFVHVASSTESLFSVFPPVKNLILTARPRSNNYLALWENFISLSWFCSDIISLFFEYFIYFLWPSSHMGCFVVYHLSSLMDFEGRG